MLGRPACTLSEAYNCRPLQCTRRWIDAAARLMPHGQPTHRGHAQAPDSVAFTTGQSHARSDCILSL